MSKINEFIKNLEEKERKNKEELEKKKFSLINKSKTKNDKNEEQQKEISNKEINVENQPKTQSILNEEKINEKVLKYLNQKKEDSQTKEQNELEKLFEKRRSQGSKCLDILKQKEEEEKAKNEELKQKAKEEEEINRIKQSKKRKEFLDKQEEEKIIKKEEDKKKILEKEKKNEEQHKIRYEINKKREEEEEAKKKKEEEKTRKIDEEIRKLKEAEEKRKEEEKRIEEEKERIRKLEQERLKREREEEERKRIEEERKRIEEERKKKEEEERKKNELFIENKKKGYENLKKIPQLQKLNEQYLKKIYGDTKDLSDEEKFNIFDRKINNVEVEEKLNFDFSFKNAEKDIKYDVEIYDDEKKLLGKINNNINNEENNELTIKNLEMNFNFVKVQNIHLKLIKNVNNNAIIATKIIPLKEFFSGENTGNYVEKITDFLGEELFSIKLIKSQENDDDNQEINNDNNNIINDNSNNSNENENKLIRLKFKSLINSSIYPSKSIVCYTIEKDENILFKSPFCSDSNIQYSDKIPIELLKPSFNICIYNVCYEEKRYNINYDELLKGVGQVVNFTDTNFNINIFSEKVKGTKLLKLLQKGLNIELIIAIDFTQSNGNINNPSCLHYIKDDFVNNYEKGIREIYDIFSIYNKSNQYDLFGFGGLNYYFNNCKYCFDIKDMNDNINDIKNNEQNIEKIISLYKKAVDTTLFEKGTYFSSVLVHTYNIIRNKMIKNKGTNSLNYNVLLIISDGKIHDTDWTIGWLEICSILPLSIVIIGVGEYVTKDMKILNGEIAYEKKIIENSNVHYVHFKDFNKDLNKLKENALKYIPENISEYFEKIKLTGERIPYELDVQYSNIYVEQD